MKTPHPRDDTEKTKAAQAVAYEIAMVSVLPQYLNTVDVNVRSAIIESFLVHYRNIRDFFRYVDPSFPDTVVAGDFVPGWKPNWDPVVADEKDRINRLLAHISCLRDDLNKDWSEIPHMAKVTLQRFLSFLALLSEAELRRFATPELRMIFETVNWPG